MRLSSGLLVSLGAEFREHLAGRGRNFCSRALSSIPSRSVAGFLLRAAVASGR